MGLSNIKQGDEILLTVAEHHSAIVPWQFVSQKTGATLKYVGLTKEEVPDIEQLKGLLSNKTKMVVVRHVPNVLGSMLSIEEIVPWSKRVGAKVLVDACQSVPHMPVDVLKLGADFLVASSHKMCGPTGVGFMHGTLEMSSMEPFLGGGEMIEDVFNEKSTYAEPPSRKSWQLISMKAFFLFQMSGYMVLRLPKLITVLLYALSMLRMFILQTLQILLIPSMA